MRNTDRDWGILAESGSLWAILTDDKYKAENLTDKAVDDFFRGGAQFMDLVGGELLAHSPAREGGVGVGVDFGSGVGRLSFPMARRCGTVYAVDVAPAMLRLGEEHAARLGVENVRFLSADAFFESGIRADWINSYIVFQHIPPSRGLTILGDLLSRLKPDGVISIHVTFARSALHITKAIGDFRYYAYDGVSLEGMDYVGSAQPGAISMYEYDLSKVFTQFYQHDIRIFDTRFTNHRGHIGILFFGQRDREADLVVAREFVFSADRDGGKYLRDGWSKVEGWGVWSSGEVARLNPPVSAGARGTATLKLDVRRLPLIPGAEQVLSVTAGGVSKTVELHRQPNRDFCVELGLPSPLPGEVEVALAVTPNYRLNEFDPKVNDKRFVGIGLVRASFA